MYQMEQKSVSLQALQAENDALREENQTMEGKNNNLELGKLRILKEFEDLAAKNQLPKALATIFANLRRRPSTGYQPLARATRKAPSAHLGTASSSKSEAPKTRSTRRTASTGVGKTSALAGAAKGSNLSSGADLPQAELPKEDSDSEEEFAPASAVFGKKPVASSASTRSTGNAAVAPNRLKSAKGGVATRTRASSRSSVYRTRALRPRKNGN